MPGVRDTDKTLISLWMHKEMHTALEAVTKTRGITKTRYILEALAAQMGCDLDENGTPIGLSLDRLTRQARGRQKEQLGSANKKAFP